MVRKQRGKVSDDETESILGQPCVRLSLIESDSVQILKCSAPKVVGVVDRGGLFGELLGLLH